MTGYVIYCASLYGEQLEEMTPEQKEEYVHALIADASVESVKDYFEMSSTGSESADEQRMLEEFLANMKNMSATLALEVVDKTVRQLEDGGAPTREEWGPGSTNPGHKPSVGNRAPMNNFEEGPSGFDIKESIEPVPTFDEFCEKEIQPEEPMP